ncbi:hypothetical protein EL22_26620 [Halostagnicola sp. A56]|uniref:metalloprotease family protein n=1 Tax=Halostagnicola sp. A56 TaxID=1495067 RepID=UPI00065F6AB6|nr:metalloprotease family protein [Halostagnicola sp. A56]KMT45876.1 hypothetical protein EL22_26620 [Halostagnicola sp. A56]
MLVLIGFLFSLLTIPGVVVHEFAHKKACDLMGVPVVDVAYFRLGTPAGYVTHREPDRYRESFVVSVAPFAFNTAVAFSLFVVLAAVVRSSGALEGGIGPGMTLPGEEIVATAVALGWLGFSIGSQAFPSTGDARTLWNRTRSEWRRSPSVLLGIPFVVAIYVANLLSWFFLDTLYAIGLGVLAAWLTLSLGL